MPRKKIQNTPCVMEGCNRASHYTSGLCHACYQVIWRWKSRSPGDVVRRAAQLQLWQHRIDKLMPSKISSISKHRRRKRA